MADKPTDPPSSTDPSFSSLDNLSEQLERIGRSQKMFEEVKKALEDSLKELRAFSEIARVASTDSVESIETISKAYSDLTTHIDKNTNASIKASHTVNDEIAKAYGTMSAKADAYIKNLDESINQVGRYAEAMRTKLTVAVEEMTAAQTKQDDAVRIFEESLQEVNKAEEDLINRTKQLEEAEESLRISKIKLRTAQASLNDEENKHRQALEELQKTQDNSTDSLQDNLETQEKYKKIIQDLNDLAKDSKQISQESLDLALQVNDVKEEDAELLEHINKYTHAYNDANKAEREGLKAIIQADIDLIEVEVESLTNKKNLSEASVHNAKIVRDSSIVISGYKEEIVRSTGEEVKALAAKKKLLAANISLKEIELIRDKNLKATTNSMANLADKITGVTSSSNFFSSAILGSIAGVGSFREGIGNLATAISQGLSAAFLDPEKAIARFTNFLYKNLVQSSFEIDKVISQVNKSTGGFGEQFEKVAFNTKGAFQEQSFAYLSNYGLGLEEISKTYSELNSKISNFNDLTTSQKRQLTANAAQLTQLGISASDYGTLIGKFVGGIGKTVEGAKHEINMLAREAIAAGRNVGEYVKEFAKLSPILSGYGREARTLFKELNAIAKQTSGLVEATDLSNLAEQFSSFDTATESTGKLNAALRGTYLNFMDLMESDPSERIMKIVEAYKRSGQDFDKMNIGYKRLMAESLGFGKDVEKAGAFLRMDVSKMYIEMNKTAATQAEMEEKAKRSADAQERLTKAIESMKIAFTPVVDMVASFTEKLVKVIDKFGGIKIILGTGLVLGIIAVTTAWSKFSSSVDKFKLFARNVVTEIKHIKEEIERAIAKARELQAINRGGGGRGGGFGGGGAAAVAGAAASGGGGVMDILSYGPPGRGGGGAPGSGPRPPPGPAGGPSGSPIGGPRMPPGGAPGGAGRLARVGNFFKGAGSKLVGGFKGFTLPQLAMTALTIFGPSLFSDSSTPRRDAIPGYDGGVVSDNPDEMSAPSQLEDARPTSNFLNLKPLPAGHIEKEEKRGLKPGQPTITLQENGKQKVYGVKPNDRVTVAERNPATQTTNNINNTSNPVNTNITGSPSLNIASVNGSNSSVNMEQAASSLSIAVSTMSEGTQNLSNALIDNSSATKALSEQNQNIGKVGDNIVSASNNMMSSVANSDSSDSSNKQVINYLKSAEKSNLAFASEKTKVETTMQTNEKYEERLNKTAELTRSSRDSNKGIDQKELVKGIKEGLSSVSINTPVNVQVSGEEFQNSVVEKAKHEVAVGMTRRYS